MGVPKFYRWVSERYPCLSEVVREYQIPDFDNLYLDMNGIIHVCSHPNDEDPHFRISEDKIYNDIFQYIEALFRLIKPRKVFFMAVDGVAPRAKMNQQRGRRFRSAREAEEAERRALKKGEVLPKEERFDSNCITPGTAFMAKLHEHLKYFVTMKISTDKMWRGIRIYLSGHETPGEGEHKIMEFIRSEKSKPDYNPNTRHCLYGLDADLIMLGLCTHEPHFSLLREEVQFGSKKNQKRLSTAQETTFHLLHLSLMREYLDYEFSSLKDKLSFDYDLEKIIDDWVLMGFLVGNDFIPHLPQMHIAHDALPSLYNAYKEVLPKLDGYINEGGFLNILRFETYLKRVALIDYEKFNDNYTALNWFKSKTGRKSRPSEDRGKCISEKKFKIDSEVFDVLTNIDDDKFQDIDLDECRTDVVFDTNKVATTEKLINVESSDEEEEDENDEKDIFELEFRQHKRDYYMNKLEYSSVTSEVLQDQAECYVRAIQWNLHYYYNGVCSWSWFYPHHYAPYISDIKNFSQMKMEFELGKPFLPFQQLLAVLPAASKKLLPIAYQNLMSMENSPLIDYYPLDFKTDLNGKLQEWEAVVLIPFINEKKLLEAMAPLEKRLTKEENQRNKHGPCLLYTDSDKALPVPEFDVNDSFPKLELNYAICKEVAKNEFYVDPKKLRKGLCENVRLDIYFFGFPTLKHIPHTHELRKASVRVFQMVSRGENMILHVETETHDVRNVAMEMLGRSIFVSWPHLTEAKVVSVSDRRIKFSVSDKKDQKQGQLEINEENLNDHELAIWKMQCESISERHLERFGIVTGPIDILIFACPLMGRKYICSSNGRISLEKQWTKTPVAYAHQLSVLDITTHNSDFKQFNTIEELYKPKTTCFMLGFPHYGSMGEVVGVSRKHKGQVTVDLTIVQEPNIEPIIKKQHMFSVSYMPGYVIAQRLGISSHLLSRMTGIFFVSPGSRGNTTSQRVNVGLNLKFNKRNKEVPGYTKKSNDGWLYSNQALDVMAEYLENFPELFDFIAHNIQEGSCYADDIFGNENGKEKLQEIQNWLKALPCFGIEPKLCGTEVLDEPIIRAIEDEVDKMKTSKFKKHVVLHTKPANVYMPNVQEGSSIPDTSAVYNLFDRIVNVREGSSVPLGLKGTITGIHFGENEVDTLYDVVFDNEFLGGTTLRCSANRGYKMSAFAMINLSYGRRCENQKHKQHQPKQNNAPQVDLPNLKMASRAQSSQLNRINHSPNSPFVPQQIQHKITPEKNTNKIKQLDNNETTDEFKKMWQQLQSNNSTKAHQTNAPCTKNISLQKAAKNLPQVTDRLVMQTSARRSHPTPTYTNSKNAALLSVKSVATSEFGGFLQTLEASKPNTESRDTKADTFSVDGTAALIQMLHIGNDEQKEKKVKPYDNEMNLQEINQTAFANAKPFPSEQPSKVAYSHNQPSGFMPAYELLNLVQHLFGALPLYQYIYRTTGINNFVRAQVTLPNGIIFNNDRFFLTKEEACDSIAAYALHQLKRQMSNQMWRMNSAVPSYLNPGVNYNYHVPFDMGVPCQPLCPGQTPFNNNHPRGRQPFIHGNPGPSRSGFVKEPLQYLDQLNYDVAHTTNNPFVPMQVTMNNRPPRKESWSTLNQTHEMRVDQSEETINENSETKKHPSSKKGRKIRIAARFDNLNYK